MIIIEFLVFVISSGVFCSEKFRGNLWAVIVAGAVATGSSLLFVYHLGLQLTGHEKEPSVITKIVKETVVKTVHTSQPASIGKTHSCAQEYPSDSLNKGEAGETVLGFKILTDGTVDAIKVLTSSGSERLDEAAMKCVSTWHYRPAIRNGQLVESDWRTHVRWTLPGDARPSESATAKEEPKAVEEEGPAKDVSVEKDRAWYDVFGWFSSAPEKPENTSEP